MSKTLKELRHEIKLLTDEGNELRRRLVESMEMVQTLLVALEEVRGEGVEEADTPL